MKRAIKGWCRRWIFLSVAMAVVCAGAAAQQAAPAPASADKPASGATEERKTGTGIVPPGVKLAPQMPSPGAPNPFAFPEPATRTLPNGLRVFVVTDHRDAAIAARLVILGAGATQDPPGMPGVSQMTAALLTQGTEKRSARDIAEAIDFVGGSLSALTGKDALTVTLDVVKKDLNLGFDLMSDVVLHPAFRSEELDRQRQQLLSGLTLQYSDPEYLASAVFGRVAYGSSAYGWPSEGTPETVKKLQPEELEKFRSAHFAPNQSLLAIAGDITPEEAFAVAEKFFGPWPRLDAAAVVPQSAAPTAGQHIWLIDKPDAVQTQIRAGKLGIRRGDADYIPVQVANRIFGGGYNSRLNTEVRIKKGLTYGAFSSFTPHRYAGLFTVGTFTRTEATVEATKLVVDLISRMSTGEVTQKEMDFARDYLAGVYPIESETAEEVADRVLTAAAYDLPADYNRTYPDRIRGVSPAQVEGVAQRYFTTKDLDIVLTGNVSAFRDALKKEFPRAEYVEIPFDKVDVLAADLRKPKEPSAAATPESFAQGKEILLAAAKTAGGDAFASVGSIGLTEKGKLFGAQNEVVISVKWTISYPNRTRGEVNYGGQNIVQGCDGRVAWIQTPQGITDVSQVLGEFERGISLFGGGWGIYKQVLDGKIAGHAVGEQEIDGKKTLGVAIQTSFGAIRLYFDPATHLLAAARFQSAGPQGASDNEQRWSDYRAVDGRQFAFSSIVYRDGAKFAETTIQDVQINPAVADALFAKPDAPPTK
jgi:zinc protease